MTRLSMTVRIRMAVSVIGVFQRPMKANENRKNIPVKTSTIRMNQVRNVFSLPSFRFFAISYIHSDAGGHV